MLSEVAGRPPNVGREKSVICVDRSVSVLVSELDGSSPYEMTADEINITRLIRWFAMELKID